ncbi:helix-turn-helix domain-containing protein [uncultured Winogradskyella sp.]|uniref:helix-turn-helix domain-containing protein n=1 Tax=uncultured Winogradskyella sp. TaxID=395353 RepID=UPI0030EB128C
MNIDKELIMTRDKNMDNIVNAVSYITKTSKKDLLSTSRLRNIVDARKTIFKLIREIYGYPYLVMGRFFKKNHATIIHQINSHDQLMVTDKNYRLTYNETLDLITKDADQFNMGEMKTPDKVTQNY